VKTPDSNSGQIQDLSIRGKRGNAAQVYPTMYANFVPQKLAITSGSKLNVHWTGSENNNPGNQGRGNGANEEMPKKIDFHGITDHCFSSADSLTDISTSSEKSSLITIYKTCHLKDWQNGYNWLSVSSRINLVSKPINTFEPFSPMKYNSEISFDMSDSSQITIQEFSTEELKKLNPKVSFPYEFSIAAAFFFRYAIERESVASNVLRDGSSD
jgi:hypothetical protein